MENYICVTCGVEFAESESPPSSCFVCLDERQYVGWDGQRWTTMAEMRANGYVNEVRDEEPRLTGIGIAPSFSIGQRALLLQTEHGNVLYDCVSLLDDGLRRHPVPEAAGRPPTCLAGRPGWRRHSPGKVHST